MEADCALYRDQCIEYYPAYGSTVAIGGTSANRVHIGYRSGSRRGLAIARESIIAILVSPLQPLSVHQGGSNLRLGLRTSSLNQIKPEQNGNNKKFNRALRIK